MKTRNILALLLALAMVFSLTACNGTADTADTTEAAATETTTTTTDTADDTAAAETVTGPITLSAWAWLTNVDALQEAAAEYEELTGIQVVLDIEAVAAADILTNLTTCCESGDVSSLPDIILMQDTDAYKYMANYPDLLYNVSDYVDWTQVAEAKAALTSYDGAHYGIPFDSGSSIAMYRTDILAQAGYTIDDLTDITWDRLIEIGEDLYAKTGYYLLTDSWEMVLAQIISSTGTSLFNDDGSANLVGNEAVAASMAIYKEAVDKNVIYIASDWNDYVASFNGGAVAAGVINGCWIAMSVNAATDQAYLWDTTNIPNVSAVSGSTHYTNYGGSSWYVLNKSENADAAAQFLAYMFSGEGTTTYVDYMTDTLKYITTYQPVVNAGYYDDVDDGFYAAGFWTKVAQAAAGAPVFKTSVMYASTFSYITAAMQEVLEGGDLDTAISNAQASVDFEFAG